MITTEYIQVLKMHAVLHQGNDMAIVVIWIASKEEWNAGSTESF